MQRNACVFFQLFPNLLADLQSQSGPIREVKVMDEDGSELIWCDQRFMKVP